MTLVDGDAPGLELEQAAAVADPLEEFRKEKEGEMRTLFPHYSPEWLLERINEVGTLLCINA